MKFILITILISIFVLRPAIGQSQWEILNEGVGNARTFDFINKDIGWIAGSKGIIQTRDGGESWELINDDTDWSNIDFYNDSIGWAINSIRNGITLYRISKTLDGGQTWFQQDSMTFNLNNIITATEHIVYVDGEKLLKTMDGGESWSDCTPSQQFDALAAYFHNADTGLVFTDSSGSYFNHNSYENTFFSTMDGGETWDTIKLPEFDRIYNVQIANDSIVYFLASKRNELHDSTTYFICESTDFFNSWSVLNEPNHRIHSCYFFDNQTIISVVLSEESSFASIMKSTDGALTWNTIEPMPLDGVGWANEIYTIEQTTYVFTHNNELTLLLKSMDQGDHWTSAKMTFPINDLHFINEEKGFAASGINAFHYSWGALFLTEDGGKTWKIVWKPRGYISDIHFVNESKVFISGGVYTTSDGGNSWVKDTTISVGDVFSFLNDSVGWSITDRMEPHMLKTKDGGQSWEENLYLINVYFKTKGTISSLYFIDENRGFGVGENGNIVEFSGLSEWEKVPSGTTLPLNKVQFFGENFGLITGGYDNNEEEGRSIIIKSEDGGENWAEIKDMPYWIHDFHFMDSLHGFAVGEDFEEKGIILESFDRGATWDKVAFERNLSGPLRTLSFVDGVGWAVGDNGLILKYSSTNTSTHEFSNVRNEYYFQNYPNPFQSRTVISYVLQASGDVDLRIYDLSGRKVATLLNESQPAGMHEIEWKAEGMHPGIYFCELKTGQVRQVMKMILID